MTPTPMSSNPSSGPEMSKPPRKSWWRRLKLWPQSLAGQLIAALLLALFVSQMIALILFARERSSIALDTMRGQVLERTASVVRLLNQTDARLHRRVIRTAEGPGILYRLRDNTKLPAPRVGTAEALLARRLERRAGVAPGSVRISKPDKHFLGRFHPRFFDKDRKERMRPPSEKDFYREDDYADDEEDDGKYGKDYPRTKQDGHKYSSSDDHKGWRPNPERFKRFDKDRKRAFLSAHDLSVAVQLDNGRWLHVRTAPPINPARWGVPFITSMAIMAGLILLAVILTVRKLTAPLRSLERAARKLGRGEAVEPLPEAGPKEVRNTISAFNAMQERLMRFVQDRTRMLAAVSHDLRTPITTLRLRAEFIDDDDMREKVLATLEEMQAMTDAVLAFAREDATREETVEVDVGALLSSVCEDYAELGKEVRYEGADSFIYACRPVSLRRAVRNLIENALRYGGNADVALRVTDRQMEIAIEDNGPGIPAEKLEDVFAPFFRVEGSRNLETGGVGLGLSITRTIIRSHGGDVRLANREGGGLSAILALPR